MDKFNGNTYKKRYYTYNGITLCVSDWAKKTGLNCGTINARLRKGMSIGDALQPLKRKREDYCCDLEGEIWKEIKGYEGLYEISNMGRIKSLPRNTQRYTRILIPNVSNASGYCYVHLSKDGKSTPYRLHVLVMETFNPVNKKYGYDPDYTIDHLDGDKTNNRLSNLEWCTQSENQRRAWETGLQISSGEKVICLETRMVYTSLMEAARAVGGNRGEMVARVCRGERSHYRNYHFAFLIDYATDNIPVFRGKNKRKASESLWL